MLLPSFVFIPYKMYVARFPITSLSVCFYLSCTEVSCLSFISHTIVVFPLGIACASTHYSGNSMSVHFYFSRIGLAHPPAIQIDHFT